MDVKGLSISPYMDYISEGQQGVILGKEKLGNSTVVKRQLSKYFYNVSIRNKGRDIRIGKPRFHYKDELDELVQKTIYFGLTSKPYALSHWSRLLGVGTKHMELIEKHVEKLASFEKLNFWMVYGYVQNSQRSIFERSWRAVINQIGGSYKMVYMGLVAPKSKLAEEAEIHEAARVRVKYPVLLPDNYIGEYTLLLEELKNAGVKSPIKQRQEKEYEKWLKSKSLEAVWRAYKPLYKDENLQRVKKTINPIKKNEVRVACMNYIQDYVLSKGISEEYWQEVRRFLFTGVSD